MTMPDRETIQWCIDRISALVTKRVSDRRRKIQNHDDEVIGAVARYLAAEYAAAARADKTESDRT